MRIPHTVNLLFEATDFESSKVWLQFKCGHDIQEWVHDISIFVKLHMFQFEDML